MLDKLQTIITKYETLREQSLQPEIFEDMEKAKKINKELAWLEKTYNLACAYKKALETQQNAQEMLNTETDFDLLEMAKEELDTAKRGDRKNLTMTSKSPSYQKIRMMTRTFI